MKGKPPLPVVTSDLVDIYKEVNDELDDIEHRIDRIDRKTDRLTGAAKVKSLKESAKIEKEKLATLEKEAKIIKKDINES
jgi:predicted  nucleic acid-binding Zn-ribbon protein